MSFVLTEEFSKRVTKVTLKLVSAFFYRIFIFSPNDSASKTMKNVFYFIEKALFVLKIFQFSYFSLPSFSPSVIALEVDPR